MASFFVLNSPRFVVFHLNFLNIEFKLFVPWVIVNMLGNYTMCSFVILDCVVGGLPTSILKIYAIIFQLSLGTNSHMTCYHEGFFE